ncbi:MAG: hypothetical protein EAZ35_10450 [Sphingobacteriia bacterium]|nr:MAG: hypothetical protein EAZ35_10450 [Sphingobacteriia bacterium]
MPINFIFLALSSPLGPYPSSDNSSRKLLRINFPNLLITIEYRDPFLVFAKYNRFWFCSSMATANPIASIPFKVSIIFFVLD